MEHKTVTKPRRSKRLQDLVVALIAHDAKKVDIVMIASQHREMLHYCGLVATGATGRMIADNTGLPIQCLQSGPEGGDLQIGGLIASGEVDMVVFLRDPLASQPHEPDISALLRACDVHNVPLATNPASAHLMLKGIEERLNDLREAA